MFVAIPAVAKEPGVAVVINEYTAATHGDEADDDSRRDWIELYNRSGRAVSLRRYALSDRLDNPTRWRFPNTASIGAGDYLRVWATGDDDDSNTNFGLNQSGGRDHVVLTGPDGLFDDWVKIAATQANHSRGRATDGGATWALFTDPTPNKRNQSPHGEYADRPAVDPAPGYHAGSVTVTLTSPEAGAQVRYTTNGQTPTAGSPLYTGPITLTETTVLKAVAFSADAARPPSFTEFGTYFVDDTHTTYILSITDTTQNRLTTLLGGERDLRLTGALELYAADGTLLDKAEGEINGHGQDSWIYEQRGIDFLVRDQLGRAM